MDKEITIDHSWDRRVNLNTKSESLDDHECGDCCDSLIEGKTIELSSDYKADKLDQIKEDLFSQNDMRELMFVRPDWNEYFMLLAKFAATRSTCLSRPAGAVIVKNRQVLATGYNGSMPGVAHCTEEGSCYRRRVGASDAGKYDNCRSIHSEANAIAQAAKRGIGIEGSSIYVTLYPCYVCTKLLASAGIKKVYYEYEYKSPDAKRDGLWKEALEEAGIEIEEVVLSNQIVLKTMLNLISGTSWRRELLPTGEPTGRIEHLNMDEMFKH